MTEDALEALQAFVAGAIQREHPLPEDSEMAARAARVATGNTRLSPAHQLEIYREQFWLRHLGSLEEDYPTLQSLLGTDGFAELCRKYLQTHPPHGFSLRDLAAAMPRFVACTHPYSEDPLLADCAQVEWAFIEAFDAADAPPLDATVLATTDEDAWEGAHIVVHPSLRLLALSHPAHEFRRAVRRGENPARPESVESHEWHESRQSREAQRTYLVVHRADDVVRCEPVDAAAFALLGRLANGAALGAACEAVAAMDLAVDVESQLAAWFQSWVSSGWLCEVRV